MAEANVRNVRWAAASTSASSCFRPEGLKGIAVFDGANVPSMATEDDPHEDGVAELLRLDFLEDKRGACHVEGLVDLREVEKTASVGVGNDGVNGVVVLRDLFDGALSRVENGIIARSEEQW